MALRRAGELGLVPTRFEYFERAEALFPRLAFSSPPGERPVAGLDRSGRQTGYLRLCHREAVPSNYPDGNASDEAWPIYGLWHLISRPNDLPRPSQIGRAS